MFGFEIWAVGGMEEVGIKTTNDAVGAFRRAFSTSLEDANHLGARRCLETLLIQNNIKDKDIADLEMGVGKAPHRRHVERRPRITAITGRYREDGDRLRIARGVARN